MAGGVFFVNFKSNQPTVYLIGILLFLVLGIVLAGLGFGGVAGGSGLGIMGIVLAVGAIILLIEYFATK
jgi:uncharacterized membrane protein YtjA (UPF0391 family)